MISRSFRILCLDIPAFCGELGDSSFFIVPTFSQLVRPASVTDWLCLQRPYLDVLYPEKLHSETQKHKHESNSTCDCRLIPVFLTQSPTCLPAVLHCGLVHILPVLSASSLIYPFLISWLGKKKKKDKKKTPSFTNEPLLHEQKHQQNLIFTMTYRSCFSSNWTLVSDAGNISGPNV